MKYAGRLRITRIGGDKMATCKDCIHYELCFDEGMTQFDNSNAEQCTYFKDASKLVELPCKVGDTVYEIVDGFKVHSSVVKNIIFDTAGIAFDESSIGKQVFLTKEEAEKVAKEREQKTGLYYKLCVRN